MATGKLRFTKKEINIQMNHNQKSKNKKLCEASNFYVKAKNIKLFYHTLRQETVTVVVSLEILFLPFFLNSKKH